MIQGYVLELGALVILLGFIILIKSAVSGRIKQIYKTNLKDKSNDRNVHEAIPRIENKVDEIDENFTEHSVQVNQKLDEHSRRMENVEETIAIIHVDDKDVNEKPLKRKLGVDHLNTDIKGNEND